ncbi:hypothetical protein Tco_0012143 [Tanacetum coccineum]
MSEEDFAKRMWDLVNQRKKYFAEERAKAKRSKPMTQSQLRIYMSNYLKNQGTWKLSQLKKLKFEEIKEEFDKLVKQVDTFVPMSLKATKAELKRFGEELQTKTTKRQKIDDKDAQSTEEKEKEHDELKKDEAMKKMMLLQSTNDVQLSCSCSWYVVPTGKDNFIVSAGRPNMVPAGRTIVSPRD